jgi:hypothetical protein
MTDPTAEALAAARACVDALLKERLGSLNDLVPAIARLLTEHTADWVAFVSRALLALGMTNEADGHNPEQIRDPAEAEQRLLHYKATTDAHYRMVKRKRDELRARWEEIRTAVVATQGNPLACWDECLEALLRERDEAKRHWDVALEAARAAAEERDELRAANESVAVCRDHTAEVQGEGCLVCERDELRTQAQIDERALKHESERAAAAIKDRRDILGKLADISRERDAAVGLLRELHKLQSAPVLETAFWFKVSALIGPEGGE